jgi:hypothetical protein
MNRVARAGVTRTNEQATCEPPFQTSHGKQEKDKNKTDWKVVSGRWRITLIETSEERWRGVGTGR